ncbi:RHS repeat-associated core domain-containing protein [Maricaulis sp.]|uniref:RHS repeat-associated core domain-containing protein n=1 Tax=Maricaulis sp. TaxID=1486257 RepID=UPI003A9512C5
MCLSQLIPFGYDGLNRLISASGPWGAGTFSYDLLGNLHGQTLGSRTVSVEYNSLNRVSRVRDSNTGNVWRNYTHDNRGSVTSNGQLNWVYDRSEQPVSMSGSDSGSFVYDAHRRRVRQDINGETIYSVYTSSGAMVYRHNATTGEATDYLRLGGRTIARLATSGGATTVTYTHSDHLGSPAAATNAAGALLWREDYTPFGEARQTPAANDDGESFTGHITDSDTGVVYMQARYYDPAIGRFLSNDPVGFAQGGVGYFNRYAYVGNDPVNATDPTGEWVWMAVGAAIGGGVQIWSEVRSGNLDLSDGIQMSDLQAGARVGIAAGTGMLGGGAAGAIGKQFAGAALRQVGARIAANTAVGAGLGGTQAAANAVTEGRLPTLAEVGNGATIGALTSAGGAGLGEGLAASGRAIASARGAAQAADDMANAMVQGAEAPRGVSGLYAPSAPSRVSTGFSAAGDALGTGVANSGGLVSSGDACSNSARCE